MQQRAEAAGQEIASHTLSEAPDGSLKRLPVLRGLAAQAIADEHIQFHGEAMELRSGMAISGSYRGPWYYRSPWANSWIRSMALRSKATSRA